MRYFKPLLIALVAIPSALQQMSVPIQEYGGRGLIIPPTVEELQQQKCLATMIYGEARGETFEGKVAVAYSAVNRAVKKTVCGVILAPKQYSIFNGNPTLAAAAMSLHVDPKQANIIEEAAWQEAVEVAEVVIQRKVPDPTKGATHYLAPKAMERLGYKYPKWSREYNMVAIVDNHHFYKPFDKAQKVALK